jgi:hypothetical protein
MNPTKLIEFLRKRPKAVTLACIAGLVLLVVADILFVNNDEAHTSIEHFPAFWSMFGFVACVLIIIVSKWFGHAGIMVREDYYDQPLGDVYTTGSDAPEGGHTPKEQHD